MSLTLTSSISSLAVRSVSGSHKRGRIAKIIQTVIAEFPGATDEELLEKLLAHHSNAHEYTPKELSKKIKLCKKQTPVQPDADATDDDFLTPKIYIPKDELMRNIEGSSIQNCEITQGDKHISIQNTKWSVVVTNTWTVIPAEQVKINTTFNLITKDDFDKIKTLDKHGKPTKRGYCWCNYINMYYQGTSSRKSLKEIQKLVNKLHNLTIELAIKLKTDKIVYFKVVPEQPPVPSSNSEEVAIEIESVYSGESLTSIEDNSAEPSQPEHKCCACETRLANIETAFQELTHDTNHFMHITSGNMHTRIEQVNNAILEQTAKIEMLSKWPKARFEEQEHAINVRFEQQEQRIINKLDKYSRKVTETLKKHIANKIEEFKAAELAEQPTPQDETEEPSNKNIYLNLITTCIFTAMIISFVY